MPEIRSSDQVSTLPGQAWKAPTADSVAGEDPRDVVLLTDVDGTIADPFGRVSERNVRAAGALAAFGVPLHLVTGRSRTSTANITGQLPCAEPTVLLNGAVLANTRTGAVHVQQCLPQDVADHIVDSAAASMNLAAVAYTADAAFVVHRGPGVKELFARDGVEPFEVTRVEHLADHAVLKLLFITDPRAVSELAGVVSAVEPDVSLIRSEPGYLEILAPGVDKGAGCAALVDVCDYHGRTIVAMGNGPNDIPMLDVASHSLVPEGSAAELLTENRQSLRAPVSSSLARLCELLGIATQ